MMLDAKDRLLISALRRNARESLVALARHVGMSRSATLERLRRLERDGIIDGYTVRLSAQAGTPSVRALIAVTFAAGKNCDHIVPGLRGIPEIVACHSVAGPVDLVLIVECASNTDLDCVRSRVTALPGIASALTHVVLRTHFDGRGEALP